MEASGTVGTYLDNGLWLPPPPNLCEALSSAIPITQVIVHQEIQRAHERFSQNLHPFPTLPARLLLMSGRDALPFCQAYFSWIQLDLTSQELQQAAPIYRANMIATHGARGLDECQTMGDFVEVAEQLNQAIDSAPSCRDSVIQWCEPLQSQPTFRLLKTIALGATGGDFLEAVVVCCPDRFMTPQQWDEIGYLSALHQTRLPRLWLAIGANSNNPHLIVSAADHIAAGLARSPDWSPQRARLLKAVITRLEHIDRHRAHVLQELGVTHCWLASAHSPGEVIDRVRRLVNPRTLKAKERLLSAAIDLRNLDGTTSRHGRQLWGFVQNLHTWNSAMREQWLQTHRQIALLLDDQAYLTLINEG